jgi:hypothetical protein
MVTPYYKLALPGAIIITGIAACLSLRALFLETKVSALTAENKKLRQDYAVLSNQVSSISNEVKFMSMSPEQVDHALSRAIETNYSASIMPEKAQKARSYAELKNLEQAVKPAMPSGAR